MAKEPSVWVIAFINPKKMFTVERDMLRNKNRYKGCKAYIPVVKILTKQVKGKQHFETVPMLFNYAFFRVPTYYIPNPSFLERMKKDLECIVGWVKDPGVTKKTNFFTVQKLHNPLSVAIASKKDIQNLQEREQEKTFYTAADLKKLKQSKIITLHCYPFEGLPAEVISIDVKKKKVKVRLLLETSMSEVEVSFENVFYTIYRDVYTEDKMKEEYLDDLKDRNNGIENVISFKNERN